MKSYRSLQLLGAAALTAGLLLAGAADRAAAEPQFDSPWADTWKSGTGMHARIRSQLERAEQAPQPLQPQTLQPRANQRAATDDGGLLGDDSSLLGDDSSLLSDEPAATPEPAPAEPAASDEGGLLGEDSGLLDGDSDLLTDEPAPATDAASDGGGGLLGDDSGLLDGDSDLLTDEPLVEEDAPAEEESEVAEPAEEGEQPTAEDAYAAHEALFIEDIYPSANSCATCHPKQYKEWSVSQHAYAQLSPIFMAMQTTINIKTRGTNGDFCIRCHNQVGMNLNESVYISNLDRPAASREGITCVVCHRISHDYGKESGRFALDEGDLFDPVKGPQGDEELKRVLNQPDEYRVVTQRGEPGRAIHTDVKPFFALTKPGFCGSCHDVTLLNGFRLEEAFAEYQQSPAAADGISCQDCHMGKVQGIDAGYEFGPAAEVGGVPTKDRRITNHYFAGPDYSIIHPGIFPHNVRAAEFKTLREWLQFDYKAGWGTDEFEDNVPDDYEFPDAWFSIDDRYDAREIIEYQFERLEWAEEKRLEVLRNGLGIGDITFARADEGGIDFSIEVKNLTPGHGVPTGFDAERLMFLEVTLMDRDGRIVYQSGDRDPNGDVRDLHSLYVHNGELPLDEDLFNLQSKFVVNLFRGGEREQILAVNESPSVHPYIRPETRATTIYGRPAGARKHKKTIEAMGSREPDYSVDGDALTGRGPYQLEVRLISQMVPVNLLTVIQEAGFDYGMTPKEIGDAVVAGASVIEERRLEIDTSTGSSRELQVSQNDAGSEAASNDQ